MQIRFAKKFVKQYNRATPKIKSAFDKRLSLFILNPFHPQLNNHPLTGQLTGYRSINITGDWRVLYSSFHNEEGVMVVTFEILGTHSQLYK